jgi:hypothetical protein
LEVGERNSPPVAVRRGIVGIGPEGTVVTVVPGMGTVVTVVGVAAVEVVVVEEDVLEPQADSMVPAITVRLAMTHQDLLMQQVY